MHTMQLALGIATVLWVMVPPDHSAPGAFSGSETPESQAGGSLETEAPEDGWSPVLSPDPAAIRARQFSLRDPKRDKELRLLVRYDTSIAGSSRPMVVFSHGAGGSTKAFGSLSELLAANGYVVVHPVHSDSVSLGRTDTGRAGRRRGRIDANEIVQRVDLRDRVADVRFVLDSISEIERSLEIPGLIDSERLAMAGHSAGAMTTQTLAGLRFMPGPSRRGITLAENRFDAFVVISGQGATRRSLNETSWSGIDKPLLVIAGSEDISPVSDETPQSRRHPYEHAPSDGSKYLVYIDGATHSSYQGARVSRMLREDTPENVAWVVESTNLATLAFLDAHVRDSASAARWLRSGTIADRPGGRLEFLHK